jgi:hypothetical protein
MNGGHGRNSDTPLPPDYRAGRRAHPLDVSLSFLMFTRG